MVVGLKGVFLLIVLIVILLLLWFVVVLLEYYIGYGRLLKFYRNINLVLFLSDKMENIFWFV